MHEHLDTPHYLIDEGRMLAALRTIRRVEQESGAKSLLALKCFSAWCAFEFMRGYMAGTTSSSLYEARLGFEKFGGETHGYSVAYSEGEIREIQNYCDKIIFNSLSQLERWGHCVRGRSIGIRLNPGIGHSTHALSDPVGKYSRLGVRVEQVPTNLGALIDGAMIHVNCDNHDFPEFSRQLDYIEDRFASLLPALDWMSLGGGIAFTSPGYPVKAFCQRLRDFAAKYSLQIYLEPGEAAVVDSTSLVVQVLDIVENEVPTLVVDAGVETHLLDVLIYNYTPELENAVSLERTSTNLSELGEHVYRVAGRTCLAGDLFGNYRFARPVAVGDRLRFTNVGGYSMVKKNFFNGIKMPSIAIRTVSGEVKTVQQSSYEDFLRALS